MCVEKIWDAGTASAGLFLLTAGCADESYISRCIRPLQKYMAGIYKICYTDFSRFWQFPIFGQVYRRFAVPGVLPEFTKDDNMTWRRGDADLRVL